MKKLTIILACLLPLCATAVSLTLFFNQAVVATALLVKSGGGVVYSIRISNPNAAIEYLHFYDAAAAADVTVGTTIQLDVVQVAASNTTIIANHNFPQLQFTKGLVIAATTTGTTAGTSAPATGLPVTILYQ